MCVQRQSRTDRLGTGEWYASHAGGRVAGTVALGSEGAVDTLPSNADQAEQARTGRIQ